MRRSSWETKGLLATEYGFHWTSSAYWTSYVTGGGVFDTQVLFGMQAPGQAWPFFGWHNNGGTGLGMRAFVHATGTPTNGTTKAHSVHVRVQGTMPTDLFGGALGLLPATCIHAGSATLANGYYLNVYESGGTPRIDICKHDNGVHSTLTTFAQVVVPGDQLTLSYSFSGSTASLTAMVNGFEIGSYADVGGFSMASVSGKPGVFGSDHLVNAGGAIGAYTTEWWVTDGYLSVAEIQPPYPGRAGTVSVVLRRQQRYTDSASATRIVIANEIVSINWSYSRIGGCNQANIEARFGQGMEPEPATEHEDLFVNPSKDLWDAGDWIGGALEIHFRYDARALASTASEIVWSGSISSLEFNAEDRRLSLTADGLYLLLDKAVIAQKTFKDISIRDCVIAILQEVGKTAANASPARDFQIQYNPAKIIGPASIFDFKILEKEIKWETAQQVLDDLLEFLPDGAVWGVDQERDFYLTIPASPYSVSLDLDLPVVTYDARSALSWRREIRLDNIVNEFTALGTEPDDESEARITAVASCERSRAMYGLRQQTEAIDETKDAGILAKYAQAITKKTCAPELAATLKVREPIAGIQTLWKSISAVTPPVAVLDRYATANQSLAGEYPRTDYALRLMGDATGAMPDLNGTGGSSGAQVRFASRSIERLGTGWAIRATLKFTTAHQGSGTDLAFLFGRPSTSTVTRGWGAMYWRRSDGKLIWYQDESGVATAYDTNLTVSATSPGNTVLHLRVHMDAGRVLRFYSNLTLAAQYTPTAMDQSATWDWCFWKAPVTGAGLVGWDGAVEQFSFFDTVAGGWPGVGIESQPAGFAGFLSRCSAVNLPRQEGAGCLIHIKFNERAAAAADQGYYRMWLGSPTGASAGQATIVQQGTTPHDLTPVCSDTATGYLFGTNRRWGGPLILQAESVTYTPDPACGEVEIDYELQSRVLDTPRSLAQIRDEIARQNNALKRVAGSA